MDRRRDKQAPKFRPAPSPKQPVQDQPKQAHRKTKEVQKAGKSSSGAQDAHSITSTTVQDTRKLYQQQFETVGPSAIANSRLPAYLTNPKYPSAIPPGIRFAEHGGIKREKDGSPAGEPPPPSQSHTTKSSSLSRDISPSRITAQVQSAMSESSQPLLLSALQGKMPVPIMRGVSPKAEAHLDTKAGGVKQSEPSALRSSPYPMEMRQSPVQVDSRMQAQPREVAAQMVQTVTPFQHLMGALAAVNKDFASARGQTGPHHSGRQAPPNNHQQMEGRNRTPSPKLVSATRSPQRNVSQSQSQSQPTQRRSPVGPGSRVSPSTVQHEIMVAATAPGAVPAAMMVPVPHRGLVQQHLLASTLATTGAGVTTCIAANFSTQPGRVPFSASHLMQVPSAPPVQSTVRLSTIPLTSSATAPAAHRERGGHSVAGGHSVISVGTGTESKQYASQGAQTKHVPLPGSLPTADSALVSSVNHVTPAPIRQPVVSLCRLPITTEQMQPQPAQAKADTKPVTSVSASRGAVSAQYQPKHHYNQHSQPAQTITSQTIEPGPVVKDFVPVAGSPEPHPFHQPPLPPHINPFTFPTTGIRIHYPSGDGPSYTISGLQKDLLVSNVQDTQGMVPHRSVSDVTGLRQHNQREPTLTGTEGMPRLTPETLAPQNTAVSRATMFNHIEGPCPDGKEQMVNPFNMRLQNLNNFPSINTTYRSAYRSHSVALQRAKACSITSAAKSLDLLRQNIQKSINKELDQVVQKYIEKFFQPAASNIRLNNGANSVSEEHINAVCRQIFEEAKRMYTTEIRRSVTPVGEIPDNVSESGSINGTGRRVSPNPLKRSKVSDSDSEKGSDGGFPKKVVKRKGRPPLHASGRSTPLKPIKSGDQVRREGPK
ncbi:hypothetical protein BaRGS_00026338, partial [Batillaria attramentaria]